jgi:hypothetical protein
MKFEIKNRFSGEIQFTAEIDCKKNESTSVKIGLAVKWAIKNSADLSSADLRYADLSYANLRSADLSYADLRYADLRSANLRSADLSYANLRYANLRYADLDFSVFPLWCGSLDIKADMRLAAQLAYHFCRIDFGKGAKTEEAREVQKVLQKLANKFHRAQECGEIK